MKRITLFFVLLFALSIPLLADDVQPIDNQVAAVVASNLTPGAKIAALTPLANAAVANRTAEKASYAQMMPKKDAIELASNALNKYLPAHNTAVSNLNIEMAQQNADAANNEAAQSAHNANRCVYPQGNPGACAGYNAEAERLNAEANQITAAGQRLNQRAAELNAEKASLDEIQRNLSNDVLAYTAWQKSYNANVAQNEANITLLLNTFKQLQAQLDDCKAAIKNGTDENMAERCGQPFDGNQIHDGKDPNRGTGTREFGTGSNPTNEQEPHN